MNIKEEPLDFDDKLSITKEIIRREFNNEISERENDVVLIQQKIQLTQRYIKILKYVAAYSYYQEDDNKRCDQAENQVETAIHPCVQRLLPSKESEILKSANSCFKFEENIDYEGSKNTDVKFDSSDVTLVRGTYKIKHTLVVGNVSKWISPEYREDEATHKWMLYIRDKKRDDDLCSLIKKVRYFLHESYKPHDIIDVTSSPFSLTRRGWGEFPVRVKIFFNHPDNKPIDFVHQLKLDETFSGKQMLGGETLINVELIHDNIENFRPEEPQPEVASRNISKAEELIAIEHNYCGSSADNTQVFDLKPLYQPQQISSTSPSFSNDTSEFTILQNWPSDTSVNISEWYCANILKRAKNIYFLSSEACVKWFLMRWPIVTKFALQPLYKIVHPYAFVSLSAFVNCNLGKQFASEWFRAAKIRKMLLDLNVNPWSSRQIMAYSRMHGYSIVCCKQHNTPASQRYRNISTYTNQIDVFRDLRQLEISPVIEEIDIEGDGLNVKLTSPAKPSERIYFVSNLLSFVEHSARSIGIKLKEEEIVPGKVTNAPSQMLSKVLERFLNDVLRKSLANAWLRNSCKCPSLLEVEDIIKTLIENAEFDIFTNAGLGAKSHHI